MFWMIIIFSLFSVVDSIPISQIEDHIMIGITNNSLFNVTRDQCICQMIQSNELISALNYFQTNQICQLFSSNKNSILIQFSSNSTFLFINQSSISITNSEFSRINTFHLNCEIPQNFHNFVCKNVSHIGCPYGAKQ
jgi:hypothetical protein